MKMPTHIVIDTRDGWTWARDVDGHPFTETTATLYAALLNDNSKPEYRTYIVAVVTPVMSPELTQALVKDATQGLPAIEPPPDRFRCHGCGLILTDRAAVSDHGNRHGLVTNIGPAKDKVCISCGEPMGQSHKSTCIVYTGKLGE
jgi:hypothetical protein